MNFACSQLRATYGEEGFLATSGEETLLLGGYKSIVDDILIERTGGPAGPDPDPNPIPEPGAWALLAGGLALRKLKRL